MAQDDGGSKELEQFCILAKSSKAPSCVLIINQVLMHKSIFVFGELLAMAPMQEMRGTDHEPHLKLLELFAYGTYGEAMAQKEHLPTMRAAMIDKLRALTIVTLAQTHRVVPYSMLLHTLELPNVRAVEDLIFECIYSGLIQGKLDQRAGLLRVRGAMARDVRLTDIDMMLLKLLDWAAATEQTDIVVQRGAEAARAAREADDRAAKILKGRAKDPRRHQPGGDKHNTVGPQGRGGRRNRGHGGQGGSHDMMDYDEDDGECYDDDTAMADSGQQTAGTGWNRGFLGQDNQQRRVKQRGPGGGPEFSRSR